jgi:hypothetical protein
MIDVRPPRVYRDTSVIGGVFDPEFCTPSLEFIQQAEQGRFKLVLSSVTADEVSPAPVQVQELFRHLLSFSEIAEPNAAAEALRSSYILHGIVSAKWEADALHVATATVTRCDLIVSWNFSHIVHFDKIRMYNAVNALFGYNLIAIHTPQEVIGYEPDQGV